MPVSRAAVPVRRQVADKGAARSAQGVRWLVVHHVRDCTSFGSADLDGVGDAVQRLYPLVCVRVQPLASRHSDTGYRPDMKRAQSCEWGGGNSTACFKLDGPRTACC